MTFSLPGVAGLKNFSKFWSTLWAAAATSLGPEPLTVGATPVAQAIAAPVGAEPAGVLGAALELAGPAVVGLEVVGVELVVGLLLLQAAAASKRAATAPVTSTGRRLALVAPAWFGSMIPTT
jgi:hypothetical protein